MQSPSKISGLRLSRIMSWPTADLELHPGLNVVVGPSDSGKTNLYRSLRAIVENAPADRVVSIGNSEGRATVLFEDGKEITLAKGTGKAAENSYSVTDPSGSRRFDKVGSDCPVEVSNVLRLGPVDLSGIETDIHFSSQRGPAFGVDAKPADLAKIIGSVCGLDVVYVALATAEKNRKAFAAEDARATDTFEKARARYRATESVLSAEDARKHHEELVRMEKECRSSKEAARELVLLAANIRETSRVVGIYTKADREATKLVDSISSSVSSASKLRDHSGRLRVLAEEVRRISESIDENIDREKAEAKVQAKLHDQVAEEVKKKCPLCGRKG